MKFAILGSGSKGNASVVCGEQACVLIDCGFSRKEMEARLARQGLSPADVDAVVVTHEHSDHASGVARFANRYNTPVYATWGTICGAKLERLTHLKTITSHQAFEIGDLQIQPFPVPHDAREPVQFVLQQGEFRLGILSDAGDITPHMRECLSGCDALLLECNHCPEMLADGPYPPALKARVASRLGHLSNQQSAQLLSALDRSRLKHLAVTHISEKNNCPDRATSALVDVLGQHPNWLAIACQEQGLDWRQLEHSS